MLAGVRMFFLLKWMVDSWHPRLPPMHFDAGASTGPACDLLRFAS
jgi:hypothetical protein